MPLDSCASLEEEKATRTALPRWLIHSRVLWRSRGLLARITAISLVVSIGIAFLIPKQYKSTTSIMPPDQPNLSATMLAALGGHLGSMGTLGLAGALPSIHSSSELYIDLLRSGTVTGHLIDRFDLQHVYRKRYRIDTAKRLARLTEITENKKSGVITIDVEDTNRERARALAQGYLDELNQMVVHTNTSSAHREREFIEKRLHDVEANLEESEIRLSQFASDSTAIDIKEQTHAMLDAGERVQAELMIEQSGLEALRKMYGDRNMRVRESEARIASLQAQLTRMAGGPVSTAKEGVVDPPQNANSLRDNAALYPSLRQLPKLAVPYADLYRSVQAQEAVSQLLTQEYEMARIEEAKDVPAVSVITPPGLPEKKAFPPRLLLALLLTLLSFLGASSLILLRHYWALMPSRDPRKEFVSEVAFVLQQHLGSIFRTKRSMA